MTTPPDRLRTAYYYDLDPARIAQAPVEPRDSSRLLVCDRTGDGVTHDRFSSLDRYLDPGDLLVVNTTRVLPARLFPHRRGGGEVEVLLLRAREPRVWEALAKPGKRLPRGASVEWDDGTTAEVTDVLPGGERVLAFSREVTPEWLESNGTTPLPPYIRREATQGDRERYQTVYAEVPGAVAAPTAGLHFTTGLLGRLAARGVRRASVVLHVGAGTFRPVRADDIAEHPMDSEPYRAPAETLAAIREAKRAGRRVVAVGTTAVRTLETLAARGELDREADAEGWTELFIYPPYRFRVVDALVTNFHLPESTLIMLVSAFLGRERTLERYRLAVGAGYRFYSYGDAMLIR